MNVFVNRTLNLRQIKAIGLDMDHTLVRYHTQNFEEEAHQYALKMLVEKKEYPKQVLDLKFDMDRALLGLVIDKKRGHLLKISRYGKVKQAFRGTTQIPFRQQQKIYRNRVIDLGHSNYMSLDTCFSYSLACLFSQIVDLKDNGLQLPSEEDLADDCHWGIDQGHGDGHLKGLVRQNIERYIDADPNLPGLLETHKNAGKKLLLITNSDFNYSKLILDHSINPYLKKLGHWSELFDVIVTLARKPLFFTSNQLFLKIDPNTGLMENTSEKITHGIFQGGSAGVLQDDLELEGEEILYLGDHIYGDVVSLKRTFNWRTALVLPGFAKEVDGIVNGRPIQEEIDQLMEEKEKLEHQNTPLVEIDKVNNKIGELIDRWRTLFNPNWGEVMRAGQEESRFADQVEKYACIYMTDTTDLFQCPPNAYFRPKKRTLPHELTVR